MQIPDGFYREVAGVPLPAPGAYATGLVFAPREPAAARRAAACFERLAAEERLRVLGWRELPVEEAGLGPTALSVAPRFRQVFLDAAEGHPVTDILDLERRAFCLRRR